MRAKVEKTALGAFLGGHASASREALGAQLFDRESARQTFTAAAAKGLTEWVLAPPYPVDLRATRAAQELRAWLVREGLRSDWTPRRDAEGREYFVLVVNW